MTKEEFNHIITEARDLIRNTRTEKGLTQTELANASGVSRSLVGVIEEGRANLSGMYSWLVIAEKLGISMAELFPFDRQKSGGLAPGSVAKVITGDEPAPIPMPNVKCNHIWRLAFGGKKKTTLFCECCGDVMQKEVLKS